MPKDRSFTLYNNGKFALLVGSGVKLKVGQQIERDEGNFEVEEVRDTSGTLWTASLKATATGRAK